MVNLKKLVLGGVVAAGIGGATAGCSFDDVLTAIDIYNTVVDIGNTIGVKTSPSARTIGSTSGKAGYLGSRSTYDTSIDYR